MSVFCIGTLSVLYLFVFVLIKSYSWGINLYTPTIEGSVDFSELYKNTFPATSGMLTLSLFIHNIIITIMRNNENQKHNVSVLRIYSILQYFNYIGAYFRTPLSSPIFSLFEIVINKNRLTAF